ncbi:MAG: site-specific integrase [Caulobacteraceae bacterium]|nr:site-specific integrase [Caulobacteraceae bacterium]
MPLTLKRRHGSPNWYIRGTVRGLLVDESTGTGDRKAAEEVRAVREAELLKRSVHGDSATRTFADAALSYMEAGGESQHLAPILKRIGSKPLATIGQAEIDALALKLKPDGGPATRNRHIYTPVVAVLHHAARKRWCDKPVVARPREPKGRVRWVTHAEADQLIEAAAPHLRPLVVFLFSTGARVSEALYLDWRDVDLDRAHVQFIDTKNGEPRGVPLHPRAVAALSSLPHRQGAVFRRSLPHVTASGVRRPLGPAYEVREGGGGQIKTAWNGMLRRAGITDFSPHDCRHTWATWHYQANRDLTALMALGGWKSVSMVMRYAHVNTSHLAGSIGGIWGKSGDTAPARAVKPKRGAA